MKTISLNDKPAFDAIIQDSQQEEVLVVRDGHVVAMVIPFDDDDAEWYLNESDPAFIESIRRAREQVAQGQVLTHEQLKKELNLNAED